jgi:hypothetical protein
MALAVTAMPALAQDYDTSLAADRMPADVVAALKAAGLDPALVMVVGRNGSVTRLYDGDPATAPFEALEQPLPAKAVRSLGEVVDPADESVARYCYRCGGRWCYTSVAAQ